MGTLEATTDLGTNCCGGDDSGIKRACGCDILVEDLICEVDKVRPGIVTWFSLVQSACRSMVALDVVRAGDCGTLVKDLIYEVED